MKTIVLTFDDAVRSQLTNVAPVLRRFGFGATFFVCRFTDEWRAQHAEHLMDLEELRDLQRQGFEIGNHTWNHPDMRTLSEEQNAREIDALSEWLNSGGVAEAPVFAYPGGPYAANVAPLLRQRGFRAARTTENAAWDRANGDPMKVPATPIQGTDDALFYKAISYATDEHPAVILFHGVPDLVHPWVHTPPECFNRWMKYLHDNSFRVIGMAQACEEVRGER